MEDVEAAGQRVVPTLALAHGAATGRSSVLRVTATNVLDTPTVLFPVIAQYVRQYAGIQVGLFSGSRLDLLTERVMCLLSTGHTGSGATGTSHPDWKRN